MLLALAGGWVEAAAFAHALSESFPLLGCHGVPAVRWLPDNRRVIYFAASGELVVVDTQNGARVVVPTTLPLPPSDSLFAMSPDGRTIYYAGGTAESDI